MADRELRDKLRRILESQEARRLLEPADVRPDDYGQSLFHRVRRRVRREAARFKIARTAVKDHYGGFEDLPQGRRQTVLRSSRPQTLIALAQDLMRRSYAARFDNAARSLLLATLATEVVEQVGDTRYVSRESLADLRVEAWALLGNARRINSELQGARQAFLTAQRALEEGTGDRSLKADFFSLLASLRSSQGRAEEAAQLVDREIALRRLLGDQEKLGIALIDRGLMTCWTEGATDAACEFTQRGVELVSDQRMFLMALLVLAEAFARENRGFEALLLLGDAKLVLALVEPGRFEIRHRWIRGITYRSLGQSSRAEELLNSVRRELLIEGPSLPAAIASIDLVSVYAELGRHREARQVAHDACELLLAQELERPALAAFLLFQRFTLADNVTAQVAVAVANYLGRYQYNNELRFEWTGE